MRWAAYKQQHQMGNRQQPQQPAASGSQRTIKAWIGSSTRGAAGDGWQQPSKQETKQWPAAICNADRAQSTPPRRECQIIGGCGAQSYSPVSAVTPSSTTSCAVLFQLQHSPTSATASTPTSCKEHQAAAVSLGSSSRGPSTAELAQLRVAVCQMLSHQQTEKSSTSGPGRAAAGCDSAKVSGKSPANNQQGQQQPEASIGCFNLTNSSKSKLTWNGFQKLCKGRGLTKAELSAGWQQHKRTGLLPEDIKQQADATHTQQHKQSSITGKWTGLKEWVQSRVSSRANSRAASRATSPNSSPGPLRQVRHLYQRQQQQQQQQHYMHQVPDKIAWPQAAMVACAGQLVQPASNSTPTDYMEQQQDLLELQLQEAQTAQEAAAAEIVIHQQQQQEVANNWQASSISRLFVPSQAAAVPDTPGGRKLRECVNDDDELLEGFGPWEPVNLHPSQLKQLKKMIPAKSGLYEWGARLPRQLYRSAAPGTSSLAVPHPAATGPTTAAEQAVAAGPSGDQEPEGLGPVVCFYLGKAGVCLLCGVGPSCLAAHCAVYKKEPALERKLAACRQCLDHMLDHWTQCSVFDGCGCRPGTNSSVLITWQLLVNCCLIPTAGSLRTGRLAASAVGYRGETLRTRFNKYALTKAGRLGPVREPHKVEWFEQLQAAGAQLYYRSGGEWASWGLIIGVA